MKPLPPVSTFHAHAGNGYRGPGAWKRPRKKHFAIHEGPLDLGRILGNLDKHQRSLRQQHGAKNRGKQGKSAALQKRLESLSLASAPSSEAGQPPALSYPHQVACGDVSPFPTRGPTPHHDKDGPLPHVRDQRPQQRQHQEQEQHSNQQRPICCANEILRRTSERGFRCDLVLVGSSSEQQIPCATSIAEEEEAVVKLGHRGSEDVAQQTDRSHVLSGTSEENGPGDSLPHAHFATLRIPNAAAKMSIDDRCTAEVLDARARLRALLHEQKKLSDAMRRRRLEGCLGDGGIESESASRTRRGGEPTGDSGRRRAARKKSLRKRGGRKDVRAAARRGPHARSLPFVEELDVQKIELDQMRLEDAEASYLIKLEGARRRKQDHDTYYRLAVKYGPLPEDQFELAAFPGSHYRGRILDASRVIQSWWWSVWPRMLRRRKAAALAIQSAFRGFSQRKKWHSIIRLRTAWGNTRIVAHSFVVWRDTVALIRRVRAFVSRFRNRRKTNCLKALLCNVAEKKTLREELLRDRLRRVSEGTRLRVFEAWVRYTETSLAIKRFLYRSSARPAFRAWWEIASEGRMRSRLRWACATLASRFVRWKRRAHYTRLRGACVKIQAVARIKIASIRIKKISRASRIHRAEETVQALEDVRVRRLIDVEQQRLRRLQAVIDQDTPSTHKNALAFLETSAGKAAVTSRLAVAPPSSESEAEVRREIVQLFMRQAQARIRHDFNANWPPPPLRCPRADGCDATFVDRGHCLRHAADVHPADAPEVAELSAAMRDTAGLAVFEEFIAALNESGGDEGVVPQASSDREGITGQLPAKTDDEVVTNALADDNVAAARDTLDMWKAIEEWRAVPTSSSGDRYRRLGASILNRFGSGVTTITNTQRSVQPHLPDDIRATLCGEKLLHVFGKLGENYHASNRSRKNLLVGNRLRHLAPVPSLSSSNDGVDIDVDPAAFEEASSHAVSFLGKSVVGKAFLRSAPYRKYLDGVHKPIRDAIEKAAAAIEAADTERWAAEARSLRAVALDREKEVLVESLADQASSLVLHGAASAGLLGGLIDDQASLLAVVILAERSTFAKVISSVWNEAVDEAARLASIEAREIDPGVATALSEATHSLTRSRIMEELIDQCVVDLTGPQGELWPDARATVAVADAIGYHVRGEVMSELIGEAVEELAVSGEAEKLMSNAAAARSTGEERCVGWEADEPSGGGSMAVPGAGGGINSDQRDVMPNRETHQGTTPAGAMETAPSPCSSYRALALVGDVDDGLHGSVEEEGKNDGESGGGARSVMTEVEAAILVQAALRRKAVYRETKTLVARNFVRMYDPSEGAFYWYNQTTMESSWEKPAIIDAYFKKPALAQSVVCLGKKRLLSGESTRSSILNGFESSAARCLQ